MMPSNLVYEVKPICMNLYNDQIPDIVIKITNILETILNRSSSLRRHWAKRNIPMNASHHNMTATERMCTIENGKTINNEMKNKDNKRFGAVL